MEILYGSRGCSKDHLCNRVLKSELFIAVGSGILRLYKPRSAPHCAPYIILMVVELSIHDHAFCCAFDSAGCEIGNLDRSGVIDCGLGHVH